MSKYDKLIAFCMYCSFALILGILGASFRNVSIFSVSFEFAIIILLCYLMVRCISGKYIQIFFVLFIVHLILLFYQSTYGNLPMGGGDSAVFHTNATNILNNANNFFEILKPVRLENPGDWYERLVAVIYHFLGCKTQYIYYLSFIASEIVFIYIYKIAKLITSDKLIAQKAALIFYILPMEIIYSVAYLREMTIQCVFVISLYHFLKGILQYKRKNFIICFLFAYISSQMHSGMWGVIFGYIIAIFLYDRRNDKIKFSFFKVSFIMFFFIIFISTPLWDNVSGRLSKVDNLSSLTLSNNQIVNANTTYISTPSSTFGVIIQTPVRYFYFLLSPLPWQLKSFPALIALFLDAIFRYYIIYNIYRTIKNRNSFLVKNRGIIEACIIVWVITDLIFCWGTNNYGTAMRHRLKIFSLELIIFYIIPSFQLKINKFKGDNRDG